jgi:hypothetical protein
MQPNQKITPKYWMFHDKTSDKVFIATASKSHGICVSRAEELYPHLHEEFFNLDNSKYDFSLFEIRLVC